MKRVVIIQEQLPHYRTKFFELLRETLAEKDVHLEVIFGNRGDGRFVTAPPSWAKAVGLIRLGPLVWHRAHAHTTDADLVIVPQEVKYGLSLLLQLESRLGGPRFAFWGHGRNFQTPFPNSLAERLKRAISTRVDWWFAYNDLSARVVEKLGFPRERITTVVNSTDTRLLIERRDKITPEESSALKRGLGIDSDNIAVFTGGLHHHKRVGYLLESALTIRQSVPDFHLLIIGDGQERDLVTDAAASYPWIHHLGKMDDAAMVPYWCISKLLLMPGLVGLAVIDSFALGVPMVTTEYPFHSPEIEYLKDGVNGVIHRAPGTPQSYADEVIRLLKNPDLISRLRQGALESATHYSVENMVRNMTDGILASLSGDD